MACEGWLDKKVAMGKEEIMNDEELLALLGDENSTIEQKQTAIKAMVGKSFVPKAKFDEREAKRKEEYEALQNDYNAYKQSKMTEEEKKAEEALKKEQQLQDYSKRLSVSTAEKIFAENGLTAEEYKEVLPNIVQATPEATENVAKSVAKLLSSQKAKLEEGFKETVKGNTPKPESGTSQTQALTDKEKLQEAYLNAESAVERASLLRQLNELE